MRVPCATNCAVGSLRVVFVQIENAVVHPGDSLQYVLDYCKYADIPSVVHRSLIDGQVITLTDTQGQLPLGCHTLIANTAIIPETVNPGRYYLDVSVIYQVNPLRSQVTHYRTVYFDVVAGLVPLSRRILH